MQLSSLTDDELLRHADNSSDPLTSTVLEAELAKRLRAATDAAAQFAEALQILSNHGIDESKTADLERLERALNWETDYGPDQHQPLLYVLQSHDIDDAQKLEQILKRDAELPNAISDLKQSLETLINLTNSTPA